VASDTGHGGVMTDEPLYVRDPDAWQAHLAEGNAKQARKRVSADVLLFDGDGRVLLVDPAYKPGLDLPGGMIEEEEAPHEGARRELREELGLDVPVGPLLVVDWVPAHGPWSDMLAFIFGPLTLDAEQVDRLTLADDELVALRWCPADQVRGELSERTGHRFTAALDAARTGRAAYLVNGSPAG